MDYLGERAKLIAKQIRYSWTFLTIVLLFLLILWTFQLVLIARFQTFWPSGGTFCFSDQDDVLESSVQQKHFIKDFNTSFIDPHFKIVCYYVLNSNISTNDVRFLNINPFLCTHINVGFAMVENGEIVPRKHDDLSIYEDVINLKYINPHLKIILSVQEFSAPSGGFTKVVSSDKMRKMFSQNAVQFLNKYKFDGLDIDWEFPSWPNPDPPQKRNFTLLLKEIYSAMNISKSGLTLSVAVGAPGTVFLQCYEIADMAKYVDWINLMSYDYHLYTKITPTTGPNAPLFQRPQDSTLFATLNTNWSAVHWAFWGMPNNKIIIGIPTFGHSFKLLNSDNTAWYAPAVGVGSVGESGYTTYPDMCDFLSKVGTTQVWDDYYQIPYAFSGSEWISYENVASVKHKANLIIKSGYGGAMIFSLNSDDGRGVCRHGSYPLTSVVYSVLNHFDHQIKNIHPSS